MISVVFCPENSHNKISAGSFYILITYKPKGNSNKFQTGQKDRKITAFPSRLLTIPAYSNIINVIENEYQYAKDKCGKMTLYDAKKDKQYVIEGLFVEAAVTRRLQALGLNDGTRLKVLNRKKRGALIIQVRGTRLALGKHLSSNIEVTEVYEDER